MRKFKVFATIVLTLMLTVGTSFALVMSVDELKQLVGTNEAPVETFGAFSGPDIYHEVNIHDKLYTGGDYTNASSSLTNNITLTAKQVCDSSVISVNSAAVAGDVQAAGLTVTLPATSTLFALCLREVGARTNFTFANLSPTAATTTVITAGTGMDLVECDDTNDCNVTIGGGGYAEIELIRMPLGFETGLDVVGKVTEYTAAD